MYTREETRWTGDVPLFLPITADHRRLLSLAVHELWKFRDCESTYLYPDLRSSFSSSVCPAIPAPSLNIVRQRQQCISAACYERRKACCRSGEGRHGSNAKSITPAACLSTAWFRSLRHADRRQKNRKGQKTELVPYINPSFGLIFFSFLSAVARRPSSANRCPFQFAVPLFTHSFAFPSNVISQGV